MKRKKVPFIIGLALIGGVAIFWMLSTSRAATETPAYQVIRKDGQVEIRDYPALSVATVPMEGGNMNGGFGKLFRFISGSNAGSEKIAMTTPVLIDTAPENRTMSFIMPGKTVKSGVPKPAGEDVTLGKVKAARFAVRRFGGGRTAENETGAVAKLRAWLGGQKIAGQGEPIFAYYDPPWTPVFLRRNEVLLRIEAAAK